jgi:hypothetical protein
MDCIVWIEPVRRLSSPTGIYLNKIKPQKGGILGMRKVYTNIRTQVLVRVPFRSSREPWLLSLEFYADKKKSYLMDTWTTDKKKNFLVICKETVALTDTS